MNVSHCSAEPEYPFALLNQHHIVVPSSYGLKVMGERAYHRGFFKENAVLIDVNCRRYEVLDVLKLGRSWHPLHWFSKDPKIRVKYVFGEPIQLTFDDARQEIVDLICSRRWHGQTGGTEKSFRATRAQCKDMRDFLVGEYGISFYGKWQLDYWPRKKKS